MSSWFNLSAPVLCVCALSACGGGGGGAESNEVLTGKQATYSISGTVTGLGTASLTLSNRNVTSNTAESLAVLGTGATEVRFDFLTALPTQTDFAVSVIAPFPANLGCSVANASGRVEAAAVTNVQVTCLPNTYTVSGTVTNLTGAGLLLRNNGGDTLEVSPGTNAPFTFPTALGSATAYAVTVHQQPTNPHQACLLTANASGAPTGSNVDDVVITCLSKFGRFLYLSNTAGGGNPPMWLFSIDPVTGALSPGATPVVTSGQFVQNLLVHPSGSSAYNITGGYGVNSFSISATGQLALISTVFPVYSDTGPPDQNTVAYLQTDPLGEFVFATGINVAPHTSGVNVSGTIDRYTVGVAGQLTFAQRSFSGSATLSSAVVTPSGRYISFLPLRTVHPGGNYLYVADAAAATITVFDIAANGSLTPSASPGVPIGQGTVSVKISASGEYAYALSQTGAAVWQFSVNPVTGDLPPLSRTPQ